MEEELMGKPETPQKSDQDDPSAEIGLLSRMHSKLKSWWSKRGTSRKSSDLLGHIYDSYKWLRIGMAVTACAFPFVLWFGGKWKYHLPLQGEMSAYYWATNSGDPPMRVWFVGLIFAISFFLFLYKGYSFPEEWGLNVAAVFLILVALVPMCDPDGGQCPSSSVWHGRFAIIFFVLIAFVVLWDSFLGFREVPDSMTKRPFRIMYALTGLGMVVLPAVAFFGYIFWGRADTQTYWTELVGIWAFSIYWLVRTIELHLSVREGEDIDINPGTWGIRRSR